MFSQELFFGLGALALLLALIWGVTQHKRRNRANDALTEEATRAEYSHPETYEEEEAGFRDRIRPS